MKKKISYVRSTALRTEKAGKNSRVFELSNFFVKVFPSNCVDDDNVLLNSIWNQLGKTFHNNATLVAPKGVRIKEIVRKMADQIKTGDVVDFFKTHQIILLKNEAIVSLIQKQDLYTLTTVFRFVEKMKDTILVTENLSILLLQTNFYEFYKNNPCTTNRIVGIATPEEYGEIVNSKYSFGIKFKGFDFTQYSDSEIQKMVLKYAQKISKTSGVEISDEMLKKVMLYVDYFDYSKQQPSRSEEFLDMVVSNAKLHGESTITENTIYRIVREDLKVKCISDEYLKLLAYHEAGHFIVAQTETLKKSVEIPIISILPVSDVLGANLIKNKNLYHTTFGTKKYYFDLVSMYLAGRQAQRIYFEGNKELADEIGANSDLQNAMQYARLIVFELGVENNYCYVDENGDVIELSDELLNQLNSKTFDIIKKATMSANQILTQNINALHKIAELLLEKYIITGDEAQTILEDCKKNA